MSNDFWQRKAPIIMLAIAIPVMAAIVWWQVDERSPQQRAEPLLAEATEQPATLPDSVAVQGFRFATGADASRKDQAEHTHKKVSGQDLQAQLMTELEELDLRFRSEPVSVSWSGNTERMIDSALSGAGLAVNDAPEPLAHDVECRTFSCRIRLTYRNEMDAQMGEVFLLGDIAKQLPSAQFGRLVAPDGTIQIVMYADTGTKR